MAARYHQTPLPVRLDVTRTDTREQLEREKHRMPRTPEPGVSKDVVLRHELNTACIDVVERSIGDFARQKNLTSTSINLDSEYESWLRAFHSEYDDNWYAKNHDRLTRSFHPIWTAHFCMKPVTLPSDVSNGSASVDLIDIGPVASIPTVLTDLLG